MFKNERDEVGCKCGNIDFVMEKMGKEREFVTVPIKHVVELDVKRQLSLNSKNVPVFVVPRAGRERGEVEGSQQFVRYLAPTL